MEKAHEVFKAVLRDIVPHFGIPRSLQSDNGPSFISKPSRTQQLLRVMMTMQEALRMAVTERSSS